MKNSLDEIPTGAKYAIHEALGREFSARIVMLHTAVANRLGLNITDHKALDLLGRNGPMTAGRLADVTGLSTAAITGVVDRLERAGFVERSRDPADRRVVNIQVTTHRMAEYASMFAGLKEGTHTVIGQFNAEEHETIQRFMTLMIDVMKKETAKLSAGEAPTSGYS